MLVDNMVLASRKLKSFITKLEPKFLDILQPNALRDKTSFTTTIEAVNNLNIDSFIFIIRYYNTLSSDYRDSLRNSLSLSIELEHISNIELVDYASISETNKIIFEIIYTLAILDGSTEV